MPAISRKNEEKLTARDVRSILDYDPETGIFHWTKARPNAPLGRPAGSVRRDGRRLIKIGFTRFLASRLAWLYVHGEWPELEVDHEDRNKSNDAILNLRQATRLENGRNTGVHKHNQTRLRNIAKHRKRFVVRFSQGGKAIYRQSFSSLSEAVQTRDALLPVICGAFTPSSPDIGG